MAIVTATQVRAVGNWTTADYTDAVLNATPFIPIGDAWMNQLCYDNGQTNYAGVSNAYKQALLVGAECNFIAHLLVSQPQREDFKNGPVESKDVKNSEREKAAKNYYSIAKQMIGMAGFRLNSVSFLFAGGENYNPSTTDHTNIDFAHTDSETPFNFLGGPDETD